MIKYYETIIVGGGPGGSSCAWKLKKCGREVLILDKQPFPRLKLCAGWITSQVMKNLEFTPDDYPYSLLKLKTKMYIAPFPFSLGQWSTRWTDYSIRRIEFDSWLIERSQAPIKTHRVRTIEQQDNHYVIDGKYKCKYLVGAGGTGCPVRRIFFPNQRMKKEEIVTLEKEFKYPQRDNTAYFFDKQTAQKLKTQGYAYYLSNQEGEVKKNNCFLIGDSAGLATIDLGEGISPSIESGLLAADEIMGIGQYNRTAISRISMNLFFEWLVEPLLFKLLGIR